MAAGVGHVGRAAAAVRHRAAVISEEIARLVADDSASSEAQSALVRRLNDLVTDLIEGHYAPDVALVVEDNRFMRLVMGIVMQVEGDTLIFADGHPESLGNATSITVAYR